MQKFSPSQLGITSESDNIFRIRVVVSEFFSGVNSEYSDNSEFFFGVIRNILTFLKKKSRSIRNSELFSELYAEILWKFIKILCFFTKIFFFSFGKVRILRTLFSELIFGISCYGWSHKQMNPMLIYVCCIQHNFLIFKH